MKTSCKNIQNGFVQLLNDELSDERKRRIEQHLETCETCREEFAQFQVAWDALGAVPREQPPPDMTEQFEVILRAYKRGMREAARKAGLIPAAIESLKSLFLLPAWKFAIPVALLCAGFLLGLFFNSEKDRSRFTTISNQMDDMRQLVMLSLLKQESSVERLQAVNYSYQLQQPKDQVRDALRRTLTSDPSINVRLAALRALQPYAGDSVVRRDIVNSFPRQTSPLVQTEIIDFVRRNEERPGELLKILRQDEKLNPAVRHYLEWNIGAIEGKTFYKENENEPNSNDHRILRLPAGR